MVVTRENFAEVMGWLSGVERLSLDTETTGLRPFHGDCLFSLIIARREVKGASRPREPVAYYFNFYAYAGMDSNQILLPEHLAALHLELFSKPHLTWYLHNAKFDLHMLWQNGVELAGKIHCTKIGARLEYNEHLKYSLDACASRIGFQKDDAVEDYISEHKLWDWQNIPGKKQRVKAKYFDRVPFEIIQPYGERDAEITYRLGQHQEEALQDLGPLLDNERRLLKVVLQMERVGLQIDTDYCKRAAEHEAARAQKAADEWEQRLEAPFIDSAKVFAGIFANEKEKWGRTEKGNPSFDSDSLTKFDSPLAQLILDHRDAKSRADFYQGFLYHADSQGVVHPSLEQDGTATGRFSGRAPNFQNLTAEKNTGQEFMVRRAIIPRKGFWLFSFDYDQVEYRLMLDYAANWLGQETELIRLVKSGLDVHTATAQVATEGGTAINRDQAKMTNFLTIYGGGDGKLADGLKCSIAEARRIRQAIFKAAPEIKDLVDAVQERATTKGYLTNWMGRRCYFPDPRWAYKGPNYLIQGGAADVVKVAMVAIDKLLREGDYLSRMILQVHDELVLEIHDSELHLVPVIKALMERAYPYKYLPLTCGVEYSRKSLADLEKWEDGPQGRNEVPPTESAAVS